MGLDFCSEAIVFDGNKIFLRGVKKCVDEDLKLYKERNPKAEGYKTFYPLEIGLSKGDTTAIVHHLIDTQDDKMSAMFRSLLESKDLTGLERLACACREIPVECIIRK